MEITVSNLARFERELLKDGELVERILCELPPVPQEMERVIRCWRGNVERAVCRALALAARCAEFWRVEIETA
jgi:hypothetical protein